MVEERGFPRDDYTPNGYLDNPYHTFKLNPSGIIRSNPAIGFGWHYPAKAGSYSARFVYVSSLNIGFEIGGRVLITPHDFDAAGISLTAPYHTKNLVTYRFGVDALVAEVSFFLVREHALGALVEVTGARSDSRALRVFAINTYRRKKDATGWWEEGLTGRPEPETKSLRLKAYSEGTIFLTKADAEPSGYGVFLDENAARAALANSALTKPGARNVEACVATGGPESINTLIGVIACDASLAAGQRSAIRIVLARGETERGVEAELAAAFKDFEAERQARLAEDAAFWSRSASPGGDVPPSWRRGFVYDMETVRMCARRPVGIFKHPWDAMQIQAPRTVLAEAAMDALFLSYGDLDLAKQILAGTFLDAPEPWVPCVREDGSYNMVAWNGFPCGTAPEWCAPFWTAEVVFQRCRDTEWLSSVFPPMAAYLDWWLANRLDDEGFAHYLCSYESGQDMSDRFGQQGGGGADVTHMRPVDLMAAMTYSAGTLKRFAAELGLTQHVARWKKVEQDLRDRTLTLWRDEDGWFHDYDRRAGRFAEGFDPMHLGPFFYRLASREQQRRVREKVRMMLEAQRPAWSTFTQIAVESAYNIDLRDTVARTCKRVLDHIYWGTDARWQGWQMPLPGVQHEFWPISRNWGAEGYGWGAFGIALLLRYVMGFREADFDQPWAFVLAPSLPPEMMETGKTYRVENLAFRSLPFNLSYRVANDREMAARLDFVQRPPSLRTVTVTDRTQGSPLFSGALSDAIEVRLDNLGTYLVAFE